MSDEIQPDLKHPPVIQSLKSFIIFHLALDVRYQGALEPVQRCSLLF